MKNITQKFGRGTVTQGRALIEVFDDSTKKTVSSVRSKNLLFDSGLTAQANGLGYANLFGQVVIGSGSTQPNSIYDGSITFTQSGTTVLASGPFFTSAMIGGVFKWNTGGTTGDEMYITAVTGLSATVSQSATVGTGAAATVWQVQQTALQTALPTLGFLTNISYGTVGTGASISGNVLTLVRQFVFAVQTINYTVNELGYRNVGLGGGACLGRFDISGTPVTVSTSQFLVVTLTFTFAVSPSSPASVGNVGSNIDTTGTAMVMCWDNQSLQNNGTNINLQAGSNCNFLDQGLSGSRPGVHLGFLTVSVALPGSIPTPTLVNGQCNTLLDTAVSYSTNAGSWMAGAGQTIVNSSGTCSLGGACPGGKAVNIASFNVVFSFATAGEVVESFIVGGLPSGGFIDLNFVLNLTTGVTLPVGTLSGNFTMTNTFGRELSN